MCGITGFYTPHDSRASDAHGLKMVETLAHRGPDDTGIWTDPNHGVTLAHKRLSVVDLSPAGHQPMHSSCGRYVVAFNGEIYNHLELRKKLATDGNTTHWRGHADTETLLACFQAWGLERSLKAAVGMFAIALWDRQSKVLTLARDRMGEKPLYWGWQNGRLYFSSELKALAAHPEFHREIDRDALTLLLRHGYIGAPHSIYQGIQKLRPGHYINIPLASASGACQAAEPQAYWNLAEEMQSAFDDPFIGSENEAMQLVARALGNSIKHQMQADVPLGAFLSGGIDSSLVVSLMQANSMQAIRTFTIGVDDQRHNEAGHAKKISQHLGTNHTEIYASPKDALDIIPSLPTIYDEPFADSSQIPTVLVSRLARQHVTVALSGDGGDELFGGYNTHQFAPVFWNRIRRIPASLRGIGSTPLSLLSSVKARKAAQLFKANDREDFYLRLSSHWHAPEAVVRSAHEPATAFTAPYEWRRPGSFEDWMMYMGAQSYIPDDILVKVDRAAMAHGLEVRVPMLDHRYMTLAWRMPLGMKIRNGQGKWLLREILYQYIPRELMERPKQGFSVPLAMWLRGSLREWAESLLEERRLNDEGYFFSAPIRKAWRQHIAGTADHSSRLWSILMFQAWLEQQRG